MQSGIKIFWMLLACFFLLGKSSAEQFSFVGARANGMGGANAASTQDASAQWHNPAAFGFFGRKEWATNSVDNGNLSKQRFSYEVLGLGAGYAMTENMGRYLDILADIKLSDFGSGDLSDRGKNVRRLLAVVGIIKSIKASDAIFADASVGTSIQIGRVGVGLRLFGEAAAFTIVDRDNLSLSSFIDGPAVAEAIRGAATSDGFDGTGYNFSVLTTAQQSDLGSTLGVASDDDSIKFIDSKLQKLADAGNLTGEEISAAIDSFSELLPGGGSIETNQTAVVGRGFAMVEIPVSYGWAVNENLSVGITAKAMYGSVLGTSLWIFNEDNDNVLENISDSANNTLTFGLDVGVLYRIPKFQFALVGHNLNRPTFDGFTDSIPLNGVEQRFEVPDVEIDPQVTLGAAFMPTKRITLESNIDLLETGTLTKDYNIRRLSFGAELDLSLLALRLGAYRNLAESWQDWVATVGVGANLFGLRVDLGGAVSLENTVEYQDITIPAEARLYASVGMKY